MGLGLIFVELEHLGRIVVHLCCRNEGDLLLTCYHQYCILKKFINVSQVLKVCRTPGPTACLKMLNKVCLNFLAIFRAS